MSKKRKQDKKKKSNVLTYLITATVFASLCGLSGIYIINRYTIPAENDSKPIAKNRISEEAILSESLKIKLPKNLDSKAYYKLGEDYLENKQNTHAIVAFKKAIEKDPSFVSAYEALGKLYYEIDQPELAITTYTKATELSPNSINSYIGLGEIYIKQAENYQGTFEKAIAPFEKALSLDPNKREALQALGNIHYQINNYDRSISYLNRAQKLNPANQDSYKYLILNYRETKRWSKLKEVTEELLKFNPVNEDEIQSELARAYFHQKDYKKALQANEKSLKFNPVYKTALYNKGVYYHAQGSLFKAHKAFANALSTDLDIQKKYISRDESQLDTIIYHYEKELTKKPEDLKTYWHLGHLYLMKNKYDQAVKTFEKVLKLDPNNEISLFELAHAYSWVGQRDKAIELYRLLLKKHPKRIGYYLNIAQNYSLKGDFRNALIAIKQAQRINPNQPRIDFFLGVTYRGLKKYDLSIEHFEKFLALEKSNKQVLNSVFFAQGYLALGLTYCKMGEVDKLDQLIKKLEKSNREYADVLKNRDSCSLFDDLSLIPLQGITETMGTLG